MIEAVIFDMDGLLIDSEPLWQEAEIAIFKQVDIILTPSMCLQTKGLRIDEVVEYWYRKYPWSNLSKLEVQEAVVAELIKLIYAKGEVLTGVDRAISFVKKQNVKIALASSSAYKIIDVVLNKLNLTDTFAEVYSAELEPLGKPHPGVYLTTAKKLGVSSANCLAIEDSLNGVLAAKSAQMKCIAVPEAQERDNPKFAIADYILNSLQELDTEVWQRLNDN
ncbi:hexitol phosphatase HxpB [Myxosarcina sp. GI1]|uniref:hexitol phosphatase HxpB n=1 Tax=Myxosarcina sp. GI1 TaxID=1541065 RepID=UPI000563DDCD|nr:hexitol phosphatase HxpB [Myxosarcina sp. GI1]